MIKCFKIVNNDPDELFHEFRDLARKQGQIFQLHRSDKIVPEKIIEHFSKQASWDVSLPDMYVLSTYEDVIGALDDHDTFAVIPYQKIMDETVGNFMLGHESSAANAEKEGMRHMLASEGMESMEYTSDTKEMARLRKIVAQLTQEAIATGTDKEGKIDVVKSVSRLVPVHMNGDYFGFPGPNDKAMLKWSRATQHAFFHNPDQKKGVNKEAIEAGHEMQTYIKDELLPEVRSELTGDSPKRPINDALTRLIAASDAHAQYGLQADRLVTNTQGLLVGSVETSSAAIVQSLQYIFEDPEHLGILEMAIEAANSNDNDRLSRIVWEALRFNPVNPWVVRVATRDVPLKEGPNGTVTVIKKGSVVFLATRSAMHDENSLFVNPSHFSLERPQNKLTHLGWGNHRCLGDQVALVMVPEVIRQLLRLDGLATTGEKIDFKGGPFPEKWTLKYNVPKRPSLVARVATAVDAGKGFGGLLEEIAKLLKASPKKDETKAAMEAALNPLPVTAREKQDHEDAIRDLPALIETAEHKLTNEERAQLCLNKNPKSKEVFPDIKERTYYCHVNITFRACYFIQRLVVKHTSRPSFEYCAYNRKFLNDQEMAGFKANMSKHPQFNFLAEELTGLDDVTR